MYPSTPTLVDSHAPLLDRPLTELQRETLKCVAEGRCRVVYRHLGRQSFVEWLAYGRSANCQIDALRKRGLISKWLNRQVAVPTLAGIFELYLDGEALIGPRA